MDATFPRPRVDELDGLRALLALWVVASHMFALCGFMDWTPPAHTRFLWWEFVRGAGAVETFMILSGFAISFLLDGRPIAYGRFMLGRAFRLYPVYLICLALGIGSTCLMPVIWQTAAWKATPFLAYLSDEYAAERTHFLAHLLGHLSLLNGLVPRQVLPNSTGTLLPPAWSISLEWQYYLLAPLIARLVRSGTGILALTVVAALGLRYGTPFININDAFLPPRLPLFLIGIGSYHLYAWFCRAGQPCSNLFALPVAALLALALLTRWHFVPLVLWALVFGSIFVRGNGLFAGGLAGLRRFLLNAWVQRLGRMSYSIYLIHWPMLMISLWAFLSWKPTLTADEMALLLFAIAMPVILGAGALLHEFVELPGMAFGKTLTRNNEK